MTFDLRQYILEQNDARINEAAYSPEEDKALKQLRSAGGAKGVLSKGGPGALSNYSWSPKSDDGYALQFYKSGNKYVASMMPIEDGDPTGQTEDEYSSANFQLAIAKARQFLRRVK